MLNKTMRSSGRLSLQQGVLILEVLIALLIFAVGILAVIGLQGQAIRQVGEARARTEASTVANQIVGQLWVDVDNLASKAGTYDDDTTTIGKIAGHLPKGKVVIAVDGSLATITLTWRVPGAAADNRLVMQATVSKGL